MKERAKTALVNYLIQHLLKFVSKDDIIQVRKDGWYIAGERITPELARKLSREADVLQNMNVWEYLKKDIHHHAYQMGLIRSATAQDQLTAKTAIWLLDTIDQRLKELTKL